MILTDREIQIALDSGQLIIDPRPGPDSLGSTTVDLTLDRTIRSWRGPSAPAVPGVEARAEVFSPGDPLFRFSLVIDRFTERGTVPDEGVLLEPGGFLLGWTRERIGLPVTSRLAARVEGKSSLARLGIGIHVTAPTIHAGFEGQVQLEMFNQGPLLVRLLPGMKVCQLIFEHTLGVPQKGYRGIFLGQQA